MSRVVLLVTSPRVAAGLLSADAWAAVRGGPVLTAHDDSPQLPALEAAGVAVDVVGAGRSVRSNASDLLAAAADTGVATWLVGPAGDDALVAEISALTAGAASIEILHGSWDVPGARLLDVVATMDRLRSPGGCPWDRQQDHESLAPYLLEEAYEAFQAIEDGDGAALREELGDVLLQVAFHARLAEELDGEDRWSIDDVAGGLVDKLVRRHPHVFADGEATTSEQVDISWEAIKAKERGGASAVANVPLAAAALTLAATLQRVSVRLGTPLALVAPELDASESPAAAIAAAAAEVEQRPSVEAAGALLWTAVAALRGLDIDAEAALRGRARDFRDWLMSVEPIGGTPPEAKDGTIER